MREIDQQFPDYAQLLDDLARDLQRIAVYQIVGACDSDDDLSEQEFAEFADSLTPADVQLFYQIAVVGRSDLHLAPDPRSGAEMTLLRMLAFRPASGDKAATTGQAKAESQPARRSGKPAAAAATSRPPAAKSGAASWQEPEWTELVAKLGLSGAVRVLASNCAYLRRSGNTVYLSLDPRSESLLTKSRKEALAGRLSQHFGEQLAVDVALAAAIGEAATETPAQAEARLADERMEAARRELEADPNVQAMKSIFGAEIKAETIELINPARSD